jgi:hypothetical protein
VNTGNWTHNSDDFVCKMRHFLQSETVNARLPVWIDLIFGWKSRGRPAADAKNLFHPLCYVRDEVGEQIESEDRIEREAAVTCVINFGQCCSQVFTSPHPTSSRRFTQTHLMTDPNLIIPQRLNCTGFPRFATDLRINKGAIHVAGGLAALVPGGEIVIERTRAGVKGITLLEGAWMVTASAICTSKDGVWLAIGQREGGLAIWQIRYDDGEVVGAREIGRFTTAGSVTACAISSEHFLAIALSGDRAECIDLGTRRAIDAIEVTANCLTIDEHAGTVVTGGQAVSVWALSGRLIANATAETPVVAVTTAELDPAVENRFFVTGHTNGAVRFWSVNFGTMTLEVLKYMKPTAMPIRRIAIDDTATKVIIVNEVDAFSIDFIGSTAANLRKQYAIECNNCFRQIEKGSALNQGVKTCSNCHRFFCHECLPSEGVFQVAGQVKPKYRCPNCLSMQSYTREVDTDE